MFEIKMAGLAIEVQNLYPYVHRLCREFLVHDEKADFSVSTSEEEILAQRGSEEGSCSSGYSESLCIYRNICLQLPDYEGFLMHGAAVAVDGEAYLFLAKSGVGKTTHMKLWLDAFGDRAEVVNGDKPILRRFDGQWCVCGTPWRGKENLGGSDIVPLKALCFVERGEENVITPMEASEEAGRIFHQLLMPREEGRMTVFFELLDDMLTKVPGYLLRCNQETEAAQVAYAAMSER